MKEVQGLVQASRCSLHLGLGEVPTVTEDSKELVIVWQVAIPQLDLSIVLLLSVSLLRSMNAWKHSTREEIVRNEALSDDAAVITSPRVQMYSVFRFPG
jgi:hypothetical protein